MKPNIYSPSIYCSLTVLYNEHITMITLWLCFDIILYFCVHVMVLYPILHGIYILQRRRNRGRWLLFSKKKFWNILDNSAPPPLSIYFRCLCFDLHIFTWLMWFRSCTLKSAVMQSTFFTPLFFQAHWVIMAYVGEGLTCISVQRSWSFTSIIRNLI